MTRLMHLCTLLLLIGSTIVTAAATVGVPSPLGATPATIIPTATAIGIGDGTSPPVPTYPAMITPRPTRVPTPAPTIRVFTPVADATVRAGKYATTNFGTDTTLVVKDASADYDRRMLLRFDLRGGALNHVQRATLKLYVQNLPNGAPASVRLAAVANDRWGEATITWNTQPTLGPAGRLSQVQTTSWLSLDVTDYVNEQLAGDRLVSLALFDDTAAARMLRASSREGIHPPLLEITP